MKRFKRRFTAKPRTRNFRKGRGNLKGRKLRSYNVSRGGIRL